MADHRLLHAQLTATILSGMYAGALDSDTVDVDFAVAISKQVMDTTLYGQENPMRAKQESYITTELAKRETGGNEPDAPTYPNLRDAGVSGRSCAPLERLDVHTVWDAAQYTREDMLNIKGVSPAAVKEIDGLLVENGLEWRDPDVELGADDDDDEDDVL